jgi:hypothetical protein
LVGDIHVVVKDDGTFDWDIFWSEEFIDNLKRNNPVEAQQKAVEALRFMTQNSLQKALGIEPQ